uniref:Cysteine-rich protein 1 n=1 Tax=Steinernema glaseri TaxID=37863 RepID=A0A1I7ZH03_9BILA
MSDCARCKQQVYVTERVFAHGKDWHRHCLRCVNEYCNGDLITGPLVERNGQPYCVRCYRQMFGPKPYGRSQSSDVLSATESN